MNSPITRETHMAVEWEKTHLYIHMAPPHFSHLFPCWGGMDEESHINKQHCQTPTKLIIPNVFYLFLPLCRLFRGRRLPIAWLHNFFYFFFFVWHKLKANSVAKWKVQSPQVKHIKREDFRNNAHLEPNFPSNHFIVTSSNKNFDTILQLAQQMWHHMANIVS